MTLEIGPQRIEVNFSSKLHLYFHSQRINVYWRDDDIYPSVCSSCWVMFQAGKEETSWWSLHRMASTMRRRFSWIGVTSPAAMSVADWGKTKTMPNFLYTELSHSGLTTLVRRTVELTWGLRWVWSSYLWLNVSFFSEVGLLSRNVVIRGEMESSCYPPNPCEELDYDTFGGHIIAKYVCIEWYHLIEK